MVFSSTQSSTPMASLNTGAPVLSVLQRPGSKRAEPLMPVLPANTAASADVLLSIETSMVGGSAHTCVADKPRKPAGPSAPCAVTIVAPVARSPKVRQKALASMTFGAGGLAPG